MKLPFRIPVGLRSGLIAMAFGAWIMACGSISVLSSDGSTGTGGTSGDGTGGGPGGKPGTGGNGGGAGGRLGTGGGGGGFTGGGLGGITTGGGVGGSSGGTTCSDIQKAFLGAMVEAKSCTVGATGNCLKTTLDRLDCGCPTYVNQTDRLDSIRQSWNQNGCSTGVCTAVLCVAYHSGVCTASTGGTTASCQDSIAPPTP
jgi:hypothetical protein